MRGESLSWQPKADQGHDTRYPSIGAMKKNWRSKCQLSFFLATLYYHDQLLVDNVVLYDDDGGGDDDDDDDAMMMTMTTTTTMMMMMMMMMMMIMNFILVSMSCSSAHVLC